jgi:hypothetical protein
MSYIRLVEDRRRKRSERRDWGYIVLGCVVWIGIVLAMPGCRAFASLGW